MNKKQTLPRVIIGIVAIIAALLFRHWFTNRGTLVTTKTAVDYEIDIK